MKKITVLDFCNQIGAASDEIVIQITPKAYSTK